MKILLDHSLDTPATYCWRSEWRTPYDSIHNLLSKFAYLNTMSARHIAQLFLAYDTKHRTKSIKGLNTSLLESKHFEDELIIEHFKIEGDLANNAFPYPYYDKLEFPANRKLRFCPQCMAKGFHATIYQLEIIGRCPIHGCELVEECPECGSSIPYTLHPKWFNNPYYCPSCQYDLAPVVHSYKQKRIKLSKADLRKLGNITELIDLKHKLFPVAINLDRYYSLYGHGYNMVSQPNLHRQKNNYFDFLYSVMKQLDIVVPTLKVVKSFSLLSYNHTGYMTAEKSKHQPKKGRKKQPRKQYRRWLDWDDKFWALYPVYASIRRHLWRHELKDHQRCIKTVARHIWWRVEGEGSEQVCPYAYAFLQWRMFWEGFGVPGHLFQEPTHAPMRLLVWLSDTAPICPNCWPKNIEQWVMHRIFSMDCINSFREWLKIAKDQQKKQQMQWSRFLNDGHSVTYWAVEGENWPDEPINLYLEPIHNDGNIGQITITENLIRHAEWNKAQIRKFVH